MPDAADRTPLPVREHMDAPGGFDAAERRRFEISLTRRKPLRPEQSEWGPRVRGVDELATVLRDLHFGKADLRVVFRPETPHTSLLPVGLAIADPIPPTGGGRI